MRLTYTGRGRLLEAGESIARGEQFTVTAKRGEQLLADPHVSVGLAESEFAHLTRGELNELAAKAGVPTPEKFPNKESVIEALTNHEPDEGSTPPHEEVSE